MTNREEWLAKLAELEQIELAIRTDADILEVAGIGTAKKIVPVLLGYADALREYIRREKMP